MFTREDDLLTVGRVRRSEIHCAVIGELELTRSVGVARPNLGVVSVPVRIGDPLAIRRVGRVFVVPIVVGYIGLSTPTDFDRVDLGVFLGTGLFSVVEALVGRIGDLLAVG